MSHFHTYSRRIHRHNLATFLNNQGRLNDVMRGKIYDYIRERMKMDSADALEILAIKTDDKIVGKYLDVLRLMVEARELILKAELELDPKKWPKS